MLEKYQRYDAEWTPERLTGWTSSVGPDCYRTIEMVLASRKVVEQAFVSCKNILGLARGGRAELLEDACGELVEREYETPTYSLVKNTMAAIKTKKNAMRSPATEEPHEDTLGNAGCVRCSRYYRMEGE